MSTPESSPAVSQLSQQLFNCLTLHASNPQQSKALFASIIKDSLPSHLPNLSTTSSIALHNLVSELSLYINSSSNPSLTTSLFNQFCSLVETTYGVQSLPASDCYSTLSAYFASQCRLRLSLEYGGRALALRASLLGALSPLTAASHYNLGLVYRLQADYRSALSQLTQALAIRAKLFGAASSEVLLTRQALAKTYELAGLPAEAFGEYSIARDGLKDVLGPEHERTLRAAMDVERCRKGVVSSASPLDGIKSAGKASDDAVPGLTRPHARSRVQMPTLLYSRAEVKSAVSRVATTSSAAVEAATDLLKHVDDAGFISLKDMRELLAAHSEPGLVKLLTRELDEQILVEKVDEPTKARLKGLGVQRVRAETEKTADVENKEDDGSDGKPVLEEDSLMEAMATVFLSKSAPSSQAPKAQDTAAKPPSDAPPLDAPAARQAGRSASDVQYVRRGSVIKIPATFGVGIIPTPDTSEATTKPNSEGEGVAAKLPSDVVGTKAEPLAAKASKRASIKEWWQSEDSDFRTEKKEEAPTPSQPAYPTPTSSAAAPASSTPAPNGAQAAATSAAYQQQVQQYYATYYAQAATISAGAVQNSASWTPADMENYQRYLQYYASAFANIPMQPSQPGSLPPGQPTPQQTTIAAPATVAQSRPPSASVAPASEGKVADTDLTIEELAEIGRRTLLQQKQRAASQAPVLTGDPTGDTAPLPSSEAGANATGKASLPQSPLAALFAKPTEGGEEAGSGGGGKAGLPKSPLAALFASRGAPPEGGDNAEKDDGSKPGLPRSPLAAMLAGRGALGGRGGLGMGGRGPGRSERKNEEDDSPQMKKLHWETIKSTEGTIWGNADASDAVPDHNSLFPDLKDHFEVTKIKPKSEAELKPSSKAKTVSLIDTKRSQNMNIMLAQFGKKAFEEIADAITNLDDLSLGLAGVSSLLDFIPEMDEVQKVRQYADSGQDVTLLGKAERFVLAICKVTYLKQRLTALQVKCSFRDASELLDEDVEIMIHACQETKGSAKLRSLLGIILKLGNELNKGTAKGSASGFKMSGLLKLTETKTNRGDTLLDYVVQSVFENMPEILALVDDFPSVGEASKKSFATLKAALLKSKAGTATVENVIKLIEKEATSCSGLEDLKNSFFTEAKQMIAKSEEKYNDMEKAFTALCKYLGEDEVTEPQALFGTISVFIGSLRTAIGKVQDKKTRAEKAKQRETQRFRGASSAEGGMSPLSGMSGAPSRSRSSMGSPGKMSGASASSDASEAEFSSSPAPVESISSSTGKAKRGKKRGDSKGD